MSTLPARPSQTRLVLATADGDDHFIVVTCLAVAYVHAETPAPRTLVSFSTFLPFSSVQAHPRHCTPTVSSDYAVCSPSHPAELRRLWRLITAIVMLFALLAPVPVSTFSLSCPGYWLTRAHELRFKLVVPARQRPSATATANALPHGAHSQGRKTWRGADRSRRRPYHSTGSLSVHRLTNTSYLVGPRPPPCGLRLLNARYSSLPRTLRLVRPRSFWLRACQFMPTERRFGTYM
ncbi:hypothetical protein C8Q80DRAFT_41435 [Daedaleopsis nitida]|nr:hypothetical protein C8Q80DRAFT_41435 [Daedaleopsis nitida]